MKYKAFATGLLVAAAILASAPVAMAEFFIPPGNSGATQYTQTLPTAGGGGDSSKEKKKPSSAKKVLGKKGAKQLESQGAEGKQLAEVVAETAPEPVVVEPEASAEPEPSAKPKHKKQTGAKQKHKSKQPGKSEEKSQSGAGGAAAGNGSGPSSPVPGSNAEPSGSGGLGQVLGKATGFSTGGSGILLPIAILAGLAWSIGYTASRRRRPVA